MVQWTANGVAISTAILNQWNSTIVSDGSGSAIITWMDARNGTDWDIYAQRVRSDGSLGGDLNFSITSPLSGEKWIAGETDTIRWTGGPDTVDIFISLDYENGHGTFLPVMYNYFSPNRFFAIDIPNNILSSKSVIRIQSSSDSTQRVESGVFRIKGYVLTRIRTDGSYEAFEPDEDGWSFQNISDNMWPPLWWVLINYQTGLDPYTGAVYPQEEFANMHSYNFPDWSLFVEAFTVQKCYLSTGASPVYKPSAIQRWKDFVSFNWNGSCAGFSVSSLLVFCFEEDFLNQFPIGTYLNLHDLPLDNFRRLVINQLQNYFLGTEHLNYNLLQSDKTPRQTLAELKELLIGDEVNGRYLNLDNGSKSHAVVPYRLVKETSSQGVYYVEIYDCNHPGTVQSVVVDSAANYWDYGNLGWGGNQGCYLMDPVSTYLQHPTLSPFEPNSFMLSGSTQDYFQIYNTIEANIILTDSSGNSIGIQDSIIINTLPDGIPIIPITSLYQPPIGYYVLNGRYTAQITSFTDSISHLSIYSDSLIINFQRGDATQDQTDELVFDMSGMSLFNPDLQTKSCSFKTIVIENDIEKAIDIVNFGIEQNDSAFFSVKNHDHFKLINSGLEKSYDLKLHLASTSGQSRFLHSGISIPTNSSVEIVPDWTNLDQPVFIYVDLGNNGTIDDTLEVENQYGTTTTFQLAVTINNGWNMVSVPGLHPTNQNVNTWWSGKDPAAGVFSYSGGYQSVTDAAPGTGYWMKHLGVNTYNTGEEWPAGGIQIVAHNPLNGQAGWNLIGGYEQTVATAALTTNPPGLITGPIYGYSGGYQVADNLVPGYGYWVKLNSAGEINIPGSLSKGNNSAKEYFEDKWGKIIITDAAGLNYTLYAITGNVDLNQYELPPAPPEGMFDIRFGSGRIAEDINSSVQSILFSGIEHPFTVRAENINIKLQDESGMRINANLKSGEEITISDISINKLTVSGELVPVKYELQQNYPNPFNPATTIKYSIAKLSNVTLKVYDMLGSEIATLVNEEKPAGVYEINFNASNLASGIYFYKMQAGRFVETKKMILIR